jgi:hypothetical protein
VPVPRVFCFSNGVGLHCCEAGACVRTCAFGPSYGHPTSVSYPRRATSDGGVVTPACLALVGSEHSTDTPAFFKSCCLLTIHTLIRTFTTVGIAESHLHTTISIKAPTGTSAVKAAAAVNRKGRLLCDSRCALRGKVPPTLKPCPHAPDALCATSILFSSFVG